MTNNNEIIQDELEPLMNGLIASLIVTLIGILLSYNSGDWTWFSRSGSLLVVIGIIVAVKDINKSLAELEDRKLTDYLLEKLKERRPDIDENEIHDSKKEIMELTKEKIAIFYRRVEVSILITGTVIWGFGDLIGSLY